MVCRIAVLQAAARYMPIDAPHGQSSLAYNNIRKELAETIVAGFKAGMKANNQTIKDMILRKIDAYKERENGQQFTTGSHLSETNSELDTAITSAIEMLEENRRVMRMKGAEKDQEMKRRTEMHAVASDAREAAATSLDARVLESRQGKTRASPRELNQSPEELFSSGNLGCVPFAAEGGGSDISKLVGVMQADSRNKYDIEARTAKRLEQEAEASRNLAQKELEIKSDQTKKELEIKSDQTKNDLEVNLKHLEVEQQKEVRLRESAQEEAKRLKLDIETQSEVNLKRAAVEEQAAQAAAYETRIMADANAQAMQAKADAERLQAEAALEKTKAEAQMMQGMLQMMQQQMVQNAAGAAPPPGPP